MHFQSTMDDLGMFKPKVAADEAPSISRMRTVKGIHTTTNQMRSAEAMWAQNVALVRGKRWTSVCSGHDESY